jgi:hypothetical protein
MTGARWNYPGQVTTDCVHHRCVCRSLPKLRPLYLVPCAVCCSCSKPSLSFRFPMLLRDDKPVSGEGSGGSRSRSFMCLFHLGTCDTRGASPQNFWHHLLQLFSGRASSSKTQLHMVNLSKWMPFTPISFVSLTPYSLGHWYWQSGLITVQNPLGIYYLS